MQSNNGKKKVLKKITTELKKETVHKRECGIHVTDLATDKMAKLTKLLQRTKKPSKALMCPKE